MSTKAADFSLILKLLAGIVIGSLAGTYLGSHTESPLHCIMDAVVSLRYIFGQIIFFLVPLVIVGFITPAIVRLGQNASRILFTAVAIAYLSSIGAAFFSTVAGYTIIPHLSIATSAETLRSLPKIVFQLDIPPLFSVMSALVLALLFGVAISWTKSENMARLFSELERVMSALVLHVMIPILPFFVGMSFLGLAYEGSLSLHLPVFISMVLIVIVGHFIWLSVLYGIGGLLSGRNPWEVFRHYAPAYLTAVGTMSSAATLPVALECARKSRVLSRNLVEFMIPLGSTVHLCGSVLTETFFCMTLHLMLYGTLPSVGVMMLFCMLLGIFAVGAPGVPGGTVVASLGIVTGVLGFDQNGVALLIAIFALQDSFGTACNITGDGALTLMLEGIFNRNEQLDTLQHSGENA
ncbi:dicarboxylate/amino acid:cation symporter [uncultured Mailhella sp.]|uniref:dicarboxylate/amino acid:cation symporter n=1 Tax=uncultured Mailhella sp. TaxID=1981031 RepID=UPI0025F3D80A|nr:dicarboxylate/amino acid:cation symporter [uncultured Mailhella sp.]